MAGPPSPTGVLADGGHDSATPSSRSGSVSLRPFTTYLLDGAWWPRCRILAAESPALIPALTERLGPVTRIGLDRAAWDEMATRVTVDGRVVTVDGRVVHVDGRVVHVDGRVVHVDGRVVHVDSFPVGDHTVPVSRGHQDGPLPARGPTGPPARRRGRR
ncbi:DUF5994 family protein [Streptomyces sp. NPDC057877]|uniref:DUF5994 family protein n=1 Tax=Streptomyces sp. NPDC057877 TaxID=3346269 RepID=UPI0036874266